MRYFDPVVVRILNERDVGDVAKPHGSGTFCPPSIQNRTMFGDDVMDLNRDVAKTLATESGRCRSRSGNDLDLRVAATKHCAGDWLKLEDFAVKVQ